MKEYEVRQQEVIQQLPHFEHVHKMLTQGIELLGYFPYEKMRVPGNAKINDDVYEFILNAIKENTNVHLDNKRTYILKDHHAFGSWKYFALFHHDGGVIIGDKIMDY
jgi:hypothetical protein